MNQKNKLTPEQLFEMFRGYKYGEKPKSLADSLKTLQIEKLQKELALPETPEKVRKSLLDSLGIEAIKGRTLTQPESTSIIEAGYLPKPITPKELSSKDISAYRIRRGQGDLIDSINVELAKIPTPKIKEEKDLLEQLTDLATLRQKAYITGPGGYVSEPDSTIIDYVNKEMQKLLKNPKTQKIINKIQVTTGAAPSAEPTITWEDAIDELFKRGYTREQLRERGIIP